MDQPYGISHELHSYKYEGPSVSALQAVKK